MSKINGCKVYLRQNVLEAAIERLEMIFDRYQQVVVSVSGGKDSTVLLELARREAVKRGRVVHAFFLDQEAEYRATIDQIRYTMALDGVSPQWFQVPVRMTNATSYEDEFLYAWGPGEPWMREKEPGAIHEAPGAPERFYKFFPWYEASWPEGTAFLIGLRSEESLNRFRAVTSHPAVEGINWSSPGAGKAMRFFPIYDWTFEDVWTFLGNEGVRYNRIYDFLWTKGRVLTQMRVSNLIHEKAFKALADLQEMEPDTYESLVKRLKGVTIGARYAREQTVLSNTKLPERFPTWKAYRDFLIETYPNKERLPAFTKRFAGQRSTEGVYRQQAYQLMINDWENNVQVQQSAGDNKEAILKKWKDLL